MSLGVHDDLSEDPQERASFDRSTKTLYGGRPLRAIAAALTQFSKANPEQGSLSKMLAIYSNEVALADRNLTTEKAVSDAGEQERLKERATVTLLRGIIYKVQMPANQGKWPNEYLSPDELAAWRIAVVLSLETA